MSQDYWPLEGEEGTTYGGDHPHYGMTREMIEWEERQQDAAREEEIKALAEDCAYHEASDLRAEADALRKLVELAASYIERQPCLWTAEEAPAARQLVQRLRSGAV